MCSAAAGVAVAAVVAQAMAARAASSSLPGAQVLALEVGPAREVSSPGTRHDIEQGRTGPSEWLARCALCIEMWMRGPAPPCWPPHVKAGQIPP